MTVLLVDIGNSRVKWAPLERDQPGLQQAAAYEAWAAEDWRGALFASPGIVRVVAATVTGAPAVAAFREAARDATGQEPEFVATSAEAAGVRNGYRDAALLGVDRWLAVIAAHHDPGGACCVVDVGTAATIDAVAADGLHLGGFIVPGPGLMQRSLWRGTSELANRTTASGPGASTLFADNTRDAIERGCRLALAALIDRCVAELEHRLGVAPALLLSGGAVAEVAPNLRSPGTLVPDLVLRGLAVLVTAGRRGTSVADPYSK